MPLSPGFSVDPALLRAAAGTAAIHADDAVTQFSLVQPAAGHAAEAVGNLDAADAVLRFGARWGHQLHGLAELIAGVQVGLAVSAKVYEQTDQEGATFFQRLRP